MGSRKHLKKCIKCGEDKFLVDFSFDRHYGTPRANAERRKGSCKACDAAAQAAYRASLPPDARREQAARYSQARTPEQNRRGNLWSKYKITLERFEEMHEEQDGLCAICGKEPSNGKNLSVDHCHTTGAVRGLLCGHCNGWIGRVDDNFRIARRAALYLGGVPIRYLTAGERESVLTMNDESKVASIFTHQRTMITKLSKNPAATLVEEGFFGKNPWARFEMPANLISFRTKSKAKV